MSFQGRLLKSTGGIVPDGLYNMQFKIYQDGDGTTAGDTGGTLKWTESYVNANASAGVQVSDGFFSVTLGSKTPFGSSVDWNSDTLWLSMNVAGSASDCTTFGSGSCAADGEMLPMKRVTSAPYAMNAGKLNGLTSDDLIHNSANQQSGDFNISGTGTANVLQGSSSVVTPALDSDSSGTITIGNATASTISIGSNDAAHTISIGTGSAAQTITIGSTAGASQVTINAGTAGASINSGTGLAITSPNSSKSVTIASDDTATSITSTAPSVTIQGDSNVNLITARDNAGIANVGVGNDATSGYALDVTGDINSSTEYRIAGNVALTGSALNFSGSGTSSVNSAAGQTLTLSGASGISLTTGGTVNATTSSTNIQIGSGSGSGSPMLLTLDQSSSTPATGAPAGSMYYDTSLAAIQCYNGASWGSCDTLPDTFISLTPEYAGAVLQGTGNGTMVSGMCSSDLHINDGTSGQPTICGSNETYNYYDWTSTNSASQDYGIYVSYQLPSTFSKFIAGSTSLLGRTDSNDSTISYQLYRKAAGGALTACGTNTNVLSGAQSAWQATSPSGSIDPSNCGFAAGDTLYIKIAVSAANGAHAYAGPISFAFSNAN